MRKHLHSMFRRAALDYAAHGWPIFPLKPGGRMALTADGTAGATTSMLQIERWWSRWPAANIGLDCGRAGVVAIELNTGDGGLKTWPALNLSARTSTCCSDTGFVFVYALPVGHKPLRSNGGTLGPGVTVHAAGEHIVLPPSVLKHDGAVRWLVFNDGWRPSRALMVLPPGVLALLQPVPYEQLRFPARMQRGNTGQSLARRFRARLNIAVRGRPDRSNLLRGRWVRGRADRKIN